MNHKSLASALGSIAWGYLFFYISINLGALDILPDWVCFVLVVKALPLLAEAVPSAKLLQPLGTLLGVYYVFSWILTAMGHPIQWYLLTVFIAVLALYFNFQLLTNLAEVARLGGYPQEKKILRLRTVLAVLTTVVALPIPWEEYLVLGTGLAVVYLVVAAWICAVLFGLRKKVESDAVETEA